MNSKKAPTDAYNAIVNFKDQTIIAIGDVHGDIDALLLTLWNANVIDDKGMWNVQTPTIVVQTGDQIDRKRDSNDYTEQNRYPELEVLQYTEWLKQQAKNDRKRLGSDFISLLGNHEILTCGGHFEEYVSTSDLRVHQNLIENRKRDFRAGSGQMAVKFLAQRPVVVRIGNCIFSHADIADTTLIGANPTDDTLNEFNTAAFDFLTKGMDNVTVKQKRFLGFADGTVTLKDHGENQYNAFSQTPMTQRSICGNSAVWKHPNGEYIEDDSKLPATDKFFISAHTIQIDGKIRGRGFIDDQISSHDPKHFWCIDTGRSRAFNREGETALQVDTATALKITNLNASAPTFKIVGPLRRST
jgi:hypothetical protein